MSRDEPPAEYLQWEFRSGFPNDVVLRASDGRELWRRPLPERMRAVRADAVDVENQRRFPKNPHLTFLVGMDWTESAVAVADRETVLVLGRSDGRVLLEASFPIGEDSFWSDAGGFRLLGPDGAELHAGQLRGGRFFARCGELWLYFNGGTLAAIDCGTASVGDTARYDRAAHARPAPAASVRATIPLGPRTVEIDGAVFM